jgi:hypothetical protein
VTGRLGGAYGENRWQPRGREEAGHQAGGTKGQGESQGQGVREEGRRDTRTEGGHEKGRRTESAREIDAFGTGESDPPDVREGQGTREKVSRENRRAEESGGKKTRRARICQRASARREPRPRARAPSAQDRRTTVDGGRAGAELHGQPSG